jgi:hypothetical protein
MFGATMNADKKPESLFDGFNLAKMTSPMMKFFENLI